MTNRYVTIDRGMKIDSYYNDYGVLLSSNYFCNKCGTFIFSSSSIPEIKRFEQVDIPNACKCCKSKFK